MNHPAVGIHYFISGFKLVCKPGLRRFIIFPLLINISLFVGLFFLLRHFMQEFNVWVSHFLPSWLQWLSVIFWLMFFLGFLTILVYGFVVLANIVSAPFNSFLSEKVEFYLTGKVAVERSLWDNIKDVPRILARQFTILGYYLPRMLGIFILFFVPVLHFIAPLLAFLFNAWFVTLTYLDYPTDNHRIPLLTVRDWLKQRRSVSLSFGMTALIFSMLPIINCFVIPAAVAGATLFWVEENK